MDDQTAAMFGGSREPDPYRHQIFPTFSEALTAWQQLPLELQSTIAPPRQSHGCWIFERE